MYTTKITVYRNRRPTRGVRVSLEFEGISQSGFTSQYYTNEDGVAFVEHASSGKARVYLEGQPQQQLVLTPGAEVFYL